MWEKLSGPFRGLEVEFWKTDVYGIDEGKMLKVKRENARQQICIEDLNAIFTE